MSVKGRFSLDTNILVCAVDRDAGERHDQAVDIVGQSAHRDCVLTVQALAEFFHATTRKDLLERSVASAFVHDWLELFQVSSASRTALTEAFNVVHLHRLSFWDAMLWATARQVGCSVILSEDMQDGQHLGGVEIINPFACGASTRLAPLLEA